MFEVDEGRGRGSKALGWALSMAMALVAAGCGGSGSSSAQSASDPALSRGSGSGSGGEGKDDDDPSIRDRSARGLEISPVPIDVSGLSRRKALLVGLGSYIVNAASDCAGCHSTPAGFLSGGNPFVFDAQGHTVWTRNLTPDPTTGMQLSLREFKESLRTGRDFHPGATHQLVVMPWTTLRWASDLDLEAIYAYLRAIPPVSNVVPDDDKDDPKLPASVPFPGHLYTDGQVIRLLTSSNQSFDPLRGLEVSPLRQPRGLRGELLESYGRGSYIANTLTHCNDCHTHPDRTADQKRVNTADFLTGGTVFATPPPLQPLLKTVRATSANLKGVHNGFFNEPDDSYARFHDIITAGALTDETPPRPLAFPMSLVAPNLAKLLDEDLRSVYDYAKNAPSTSSASDVEHQPPARFCQAATDCAAGESCADATHECVGGACSADEDCGSCQTCGAGTCLAPAADSVCLLTAQ